MNIKSIINRIAGDTVIEYKNIPMIGKLNVQRGTGKYGILEVPEDFINKVYEAIYEKGMEKPEYKPHISVITDEELEEIGKVKEQGKDFPFTMISIDSVEPEGWEEMERVWFIKCKSKELEELRKNYGLTPLVNKTHEFHITVAVRPKK